MQNCIFSGHCCQYLCDKSCPTLTETTYLLERNNINMNSEVFRADSGRLKYLTKLLEHAEGKVATVICENSNTVDVSNLLTYCGICKHWKGSRLHCSVYNLQYSKYIDMMQGSWNNRSESAELEFMKIWASNAKLLIISNIDYVNFRDFQCQTLLTLLQSRSSSELTTLIVSPPVSSLVGESRFFSRLTDILQKGIIK